MEVSYRTRPYEICSGVQENVIIYCLFTSSSLKERKQYLSTLILRIMLLLLINWSIFSLICSMNLVSGCFSLLNKVIKSLQQGIKPILNTHFKDVNVVLVCAWTCYSYLWFSFLLFLFSLTNSHFWNILGFCWILFILIIYVILGPHRFFFFGFSEYL